MVATMSGHGGVVEELLGAGADHSLQNKVSE